MKKAKELKQFKRRMQRYKTVAEKRLYLELLQTYKDKEELKTQVILGFYILDFVLLPKLLVIEVDGDSHKRQIQYDSHRDKFINGCGLKVLRVSNDDVLFNIQNVLETISSFENENDYFKRFRHACSHGNVLRGKYIQRLRKISPGQTKFL